MDSDGDGKIARKEWMGPPQAFGEIDTDSDDYLTPEELETWFAKRKSQGPNPQKVLNRMDSDGDGQISSSEFIGRRRPFSFFDRNGDGFATREEIAAAIQMARQQRIQEGGPSISIAGFLGRDEIEKLLTGTRVSHISAQNYKAKITFKGDGSVKSVNEGGKRGGGKWWIKGPGVFCMDTFTGRMNKDFCILLKRQGNKIFHYHPKTRTLASSHPWEIEAPGPRAHLVEDTD